MSCQDRSSGSRNYSATESLLIHVQIHESHTHIHTHTHIRRQVRGSWDASHIQSRPVRLPQAMMVEAGGSLARLQPPPSQHSNRVELAPSPWELDYLEFQTSVPALAASSQLICRIFTSSRTVFFAAVFSKSSLRKRKKKNFFL